MDKFCLILCDTLLLKYSLFWGRPLQFKNIIIIFFLKQTSKKKRHETNTFMYNMPQKNEVEMVTEKKKVQQ